MHKTPLFGIILGILLILAILCSGLLIENRTFTWQQPHTPVRSDFGDSAYLVARNYKQLLDCTEAILSAGEDVGSIRYYHDTEDISAELAVACDEITHHTPIGAFAVESLKMEPTRVLSYHNIRVSVKYKRTEDEITSLYPLNSSSELQDILRPALTTLKPSLLLTMEYFSPELLNLAENLSSLLVSDPDCCYGLSGYSVHTYPDEGLDRIVEIRFNYDCSPEEALSRRNATTQEIQTITNQMESDRAPVILRSFYDRIVSSTEWDEASVAKTPYHVLFENRGTSYAIAATFYKLCRAKNLPCYIVQGTYRGTPHTWNLIYLDNKWHHIDLAHGSRSPASYDLFMVSSENMKDYEWKTPNLEH
ncbi:MAG: hypothetical protein E7471_02605 [Ruminococcaceae bacterium]|nr:hypothetical protein [Oscillospiraceae bacterium]